MTEHIAPELRHVARQLRARYPGVRIVEAAFGSRGDGVPQQVIRFQARPEVLRCHGLLTPYMESGTGTTEMGDAFRLSTRRLDDESRPGCWDLSIFTGPVPRENRPASTSEATDLLRKIARGGA